MAGRKLTGNKAVGHQLRAKTEDLEMLLKVSRSGAMVEELEKRSYEYEGKMLAKKRYVRVKNEV